MNESAREKLILDKLINGETISIHNKSYKIEGDVGTNLLNFIRSQDSKYLEPPFNRDKMIRLLEEVKPFIYEEKSKMETTEIPHRNSSKRILHIKSMTTFNFRGLQQYGSSTFKYDFKPEPYLITGVNGAGKTSVLNAIVWAFTGQLLWDRSMPDSPPQVDLKYQTSSSSDVFTLRKNWPIQVALPDRIIAKDAEPNCWVEVELVNMEDDSSFVVKREYKNNKDMVYGTEEIDSLSIDLSLLMPGRVNHIQINKEATFGSLLFQISGLDAINKYAIFSNSNGIGRMLTTQINQLEKQRDILKDDFKKQSNEFNTMLPLDLKTEYDQIASEETDSSIRANRKIEWLESQEKLQLRNLCEVLAITNTEDLNDEKLAEIGKLILVAFENIKCKFPTDWPIIKNIFNAINSWDLNAEKKWTEIQDSIKQQLELSIEWYSKHKQSKKLRLKLVAAELISNSNELEDCPLCERTFPHEHPLKEELKMLKDQDPIATKSVNEILGGLKHKLSIALPSTFKEISIVSIKEILSESYDDSIGKHLNGQLTKVREIGESALVDLTSKWELAENNNVIDYSAIKTKLSSDISVIELFEAFERELDVCNKKVHFISSISKNFNNIISDLESALGYSERVDPGTLLNKLSKANDIASSAKPIQLSILKLQSLLELLSKVKDTSSQIQYVQKIKDANSKLEILGSIANGLLLEDIDKAEEEINATYEKLYAGEEFSLKKIIPTINGRNLFLSFWVEYKDMLIEASSILNASRIRAVLWSYVFALFTVGSRHSDGDWLNFMIIDEPLTSFDQEHQRSFAQLVFDVNTPHQILIASHDLRWPRELQNLSESLKLSTNYLSCYGLSLQRDSVRLSEWESQINIKWSRWKSDETNIEEGRDYVAAVREWCEDELKDVLIWASEPSLARDTLGVLIKKLEKAYDNDQIYGIEHVNELINSLRLIVVDLQNSHHGCAERRNIHKNEILKVNKQLKEKIPNCIYVLRSTLYHRLGKLSIV